MNKLDRRSALALFGLLAASAAGVKPAASQTMDITGKDTTLAPGVVQRVYGEGPASSPVLRVSRCVTSSCSRDRRRAQILSAGPRTVYVCACTGRKPNLWRSLSQQHRRFSPSPCDEQRDCAGRVAASYANSNRDG